jgi:hypothetical protein
MEVRPVESELFHADRRRDITKLIVTFRNFANAPKNGSEIAVSPLGLYTFQGYGSASRIVRA